MANIIAQNLAEVGVTATVDAPDWSAVVGSYETGDFDTGIVWSNNAATPVPVLPRHHVDQDGQAGRREDHENYHRFGDPRPTPC